MSMKITGLDELTRKLKSLERKAKALDGTHQVPLSDLLSVSFLGRYTKFASFSEFEDKILENGFSIETQQDFENLPESEWNLFIARYTHFSSWDELIQKAGAEWAKKQLGF